MHVVRRNHSATPSDHHDASLRRDDQGHSGPGRMPPEFPHHQQHHLGPLPLPLPHQRPSVVIPPGRLPPIGSDIVAPSPSTGEMSQLLDFEMMKRKRDLEDSGRHPSHQRQKSAGPFPPGAVGYIDYLPRSAERLPLLYGDAESFSDLLSLLGDYEGVLDRHESLAANLGAKLTGPRLLKGIERFFDGPIRTNSPPHYPNPITWLDVVAFAKSNPNDFVLATLPNGVRCCQFICKGLQVEITEDDWRLISTGALDRFPLEHPFEEDETAELATLDILEQRSSVLCKKAEEVAARARILHHKLGHRKHDISRRRMTQEGSTPSGGSSKFSPINPGHSPRNPALSPSYDLHSDLLQQFTAASASLYESRSVSGASTSAFSTAMPTSPSMSSLHQHRLSGQSARSNAGSGTGPAPTDTPQVTSPDSSQVEALRVLITQRTDRLQKGEPINPPCDRCRRLRLACVKHLTACQGCTKKHAKCSWRGVSEEEVARLKTEMGVPLDAEPIAPGARAVTPTASVTGESRPNSRGEASGLYSPKTIPLNGRDMDRAALPQSPRVAHLGSPRAPARSPAEPSPSLGSLLNPDH